jgi:superfamily I DNA and/or RNA helicase
LTIKIAKLKERSNWIIVGGLFVGPLLNAQNESKELGKRLQQARQKLDEVSKEKTRLENVRDKEISESDEAFRLKEKEKITQEAEAQFKFKIQQRLRQLQVIFSQLKNMPAFPKAISSNSLNTFIEAIRDFHQLAKARYGLLLDWHTLLQERHQSLYPTLIRMADVVGATCIGVATDARFEDLDFDLVVADEAGQIQVMDLLVPLIRAKKAVLVGDHHQLPPIVEHELERLVDPENNELLTWLNKSLFEILIKRETVPNNRKVLLNTQYRIPKMVADFISKEFYDGNYKTGKIKPYKDPIFTKPMVFINTQRITDRRERVIYEVDGNAGFINKLESQLIIDLVLVYQEKNKEWGVIVPYKKQAERIRQGLRDHIPVDVLNDWVSTVDAFQGKERDVIIYGFTRSNEFGNVGFLAEVRRLNVSLTRARGQLIVIGDAGFLTETSNKEFTDLIKRMLAVVKNENGAFVYAG